MKKILDTMTIGKRSCEIVAEIPEAADIRAILPRRAAELAIARMSLSEAEIRRHLVVGSTPPTNIPLSPSWRLRIIQKVIWSIYETSRGCICL